MSFAQINEPDCSFPDVWKYFEDALDERLRMSKDEDDPLFWRVAVPSIVAENFDLQHADSTKETILIQIGSCSHWLRPHQTRQKIAGGFAHPYGYGDGNYGYSGLGLPQFNWSLTWKQVPGQRAWEPVKGRPGRRPLVLRMALPTRTLRHPQAAIHTCWDPGSPLDPRTKSDQLYFFRKLGHKWERVAEILTDQKVS